LPIVYEKIIKRYKFNLLLYTNGPGSYMSIKMTYIFLKTISIVDDIPLKAALGFEFNNNQPIKSLRNFYFIQENGEILQKKFQNPPINYFFLPPKLDTSIFSDENEPLYILKAA
jgi:hypothetical protein